jgi:hypothetical protein
MRQLLGPFVLVCSLLPRAAAADSVTITHDFDDRTPGVQSYFERNLLLETLLPDGTTLPVDIVSSPDAITAPNFVKPSVDGAGLKGTFVFPATSGLSPEARSVLVTITGPPSTVPYTLSIFGRDGALLGSTGGTISQGLGFGRREPDIASFVFQPGASWQGLDDIRFTGHVVPEPGTMLLAATGLAAAWRRARARGRGSSSRI